MPVRTASRIYHPVLRHGIQENVMRNALHGMLCILFLFYLGTNAIRLKKQIMLNNFLGGLAWGIGTVIGATVIAGSVVYILNRMGIFNAFGSLFGN